MQVEWRGHSSPTCCNRIHLNLFALRSSVDTKTSSSHLLAPLAPARTFTQEPPCEPFTIFYSSSAATVEHFYHERFHRYLLIASMSQLRFVGIFFSLSHLELLFGTLYRIVCYHLVDLIVQSCFFMETVIYRIFPWYFHA